MKPEVCPETHVPSCYDGLNVLGLRRLEHMLCARRSYIVLVIANKRYNFVIFKNNKKYIPDIAGLLTLLVMGWVMSILVELSKVPGPLWIAIYFGWAATALFVWYKMDSYKNNWLTIAGFSIGGAVLWYAVTRMASHFVFGAGESTLSKIFDLAIALMMAPGLTFIALAGWVRQLIQQKGLGRQ